MTVKKLTTPLLVLFVLFTILFNLPVNAKTEPTDAFQGVSLTPSPQSRIIRPQELTVDNQAEQEKKPKPTKTAIPTNIPTPVPTQPIYTPGYYMPDYRTKEEIDAQRFHAF